MGLGDPRGLVHCSSRPIWSLKKPRHLWLWIIQISSCVLTYPTHKVSEELHNLGGTRGIWYSVVKTIQTLRFQIWYNTYSPLRFSVWIELMACTLHPVQMLFTVQPVARFSGEQISWYDYFLIHTVLVFKNELPASANEEYVMDLVIFLTISRLLLHFFLPYAVLFYWYRQLALI